MKNMRNKLITAFALAIAGYAGHADAQTCVGTADAGECPTTDPSQITVNTTWCGPDNPGPIILNEPVFVKDGAVLTIQAPCIVRGQPRQAVVQAGVSAGTPGSLIVTQTGKVVAVGSADSPIVFTTAAVDNAAPLGAADNVDGNPAFFDPYPGGGSNFLDDNPVFEPLSPLNSQGAQNVALWGGVVLLGNAPTNNSNFQGVGYGQVTVEGFLVPGFPVADVKYGGVNPHDSSGRLEYVSIRHGGDEIGNSNELNCLSMGGVGDGTKLSYIECYTNFDDGFEWFGGTVDSDHLVSAYIGDDLFDLDEGFTGVGQFWFGVAGGFNQNSGASFGTSSGDKCGEWDGDNYVFNPGTPDLHNTNVRFQLPSIPGPGAGTDGTPWPLSNPAVYNMTCIGASPVPNGFANPAVNPLSAGQLSGKRGIDMRNGFAGRLINGMVVNTGTGVGLDVRNGDGAAPGFQAETNNVGSGANTGLALIAVVSSTFDDVAAMGAAETTALTTGDAIRVSLGAPNTNNSLNCVNDVRAGVGVNPAYAGLTQENSFLIPTGSRASRASS